MLTAMGSAIRAHHQRPAQGGPGLSSSRPRRRRLLPGEASTFRAHHRASWATAAAFALLAIVAGMASPSVAQAADNIHEVATSTYIVVPEAGRIRVTISLAVTNHVPDSVSFVSCTRWEFDPYLGWYTVPDRCPRTTRYYVNDTYVWVDAGARNLKVTADRGTVKRVVTTRGTEVVGYRLTFSPIYRNQTRKLTISYEIVGGAPRSETLARVGQAYVSFCATSHGASTELDSETVKIVLPIGFDPDVWPAAMSQTTANGSLVLSTKIGGEEAASFYRCLIGTNDAALRATTLTAASGIPIRILSWPEDDEWRAAMTRSAGRTLDALVDLIGRPPRPSEIVVRETAGGLLGEYAGRYDPETSTAFIGEDYRQPALVGHELAHAWFDAATFGSRWMYEGLAEWAAVEIGGPSTGGCTAPPYPGFGTLDLDEWPILGPRSSEQDKERVGYLYEAACSLFERVADRAGPDGMRSALGVLFSGGAAYDGAVPRRGAGRPVDWRYLLDVLDERALTPSGGGDLEFVEQLFVHHGVASSGDLVGRASARAAYHRLLGELDSWSMPSLVPTALEAWDFATAQGMIRSLSTALAEVRAADQLVPELDAANGPVRAAVEAASSAGDLTRAAELASEQRRAAEAVVAAREVLGLPRDPLEELGLIGTDLDALDDPILGAAARADRGAAESGLASLRETLADARQQGVTRLAAGGIPLVGVLVLGGWVVRRRRRRGGTGRAAGMPPRVVAGPVVEGSTDVAEEGSGGTSTQGSDPDEAARGGP